MTVQNFNHRSLKVLITGTSGTGKTTLWEKLIRKEKARLKFVLDHQGEFAHRFGKKSVTDPDGLLLACAQGGWVIFDPVEMFRGKPVEAFNFFADFVLSVSEKIQGRKIFACDELQKLTSTREEPQEFLALLDTGRRYQVDCFLISQSPNRIHNAIRNQLTEVYTFRQSDANAVAFLDDNGVPANEVRGLQGHDWLWKNLTTGEMKKNGEPFSTELPVQPQPPAA